jgi:hypothetical protein
LIRRYDDTNGWVDVVTPAGAFELALDWQGVVWALGVKGAQRVVYKANMGSNGLPTSWTQYAAPNGVHITGGADLHGSLVPGGPAPGWDHIPVDIVDSSQGVSIFNNEASSWSPAMTIPFTVREASGALPYLWVVNDADGTIWYVR